MRIGPVIFLLLALLVLGFGLWNLYVRFVAGPEPHLSAEEEQLRAEVRSSQADLEARVKVAEVMVEQARKIRDTIPHDDPKVNRAKIVSFDVSFQSANETAPLDAVIFQNYYSSSITIAQLNSLQCYHS